MKGFWREFRSRSRCGGASILQELAAIGFADIRKAVNNTKCGRAYALPWSPLIRAIKPSGAHAVAEPKFLLPVVVLPEPLLGRTSWLS
jgi:hypothetical protein